jgi:DNA polymerase-3 subunit gamma/tau
MISTLIEEKNKLKYSSLQMIIVEMALLKLAIDDRITVTEKPVYQIKKNELAADHAAVVEKSAIKLEISEEAIGQNMISRKNNTFLEKTDTSKTEGQKSGIKVQEQDVDLEDRNQNKDRIIDGHNPETNSNEKYDEQKLFKILCQEVGKTNPGQAMFLQRGEPTLAKTGELTVIFSSENKNYFNFVNKPELVSTFEAALQKCIGNKISLAVKLEEENFAELDMLEKTKRIVKEDAEKIINCNSINEK